ncbi:small RNA 2'-O-methyltransferase (macronuclear) [Tetrahymena thermophila SB210]|uniref:Small RNA 2'-O-methyltransferase n=1 Tax=Tetrahymena thermophila (strain SB210) TaxID=312017 RepID=HENMT_TETTS|nr:small RNA 2'-O-methyltransferase [Tetrahymena thermophila SB210]Q230X8.3 RecName: Full=Small RNA 2'-O-methyltransferase; AltName: Full=HEN1 methyltransferase homolog 1 [Tetrahymena thermophila SB210]EAR91161.3 small RNA 2'-O-methyltransferase [Tetrahymena thermophila SB210]CAQ86608.1 methyltransferase [Tetrahymena thermophila]|eukprot:XP_001011406.3 small RNA 2'-O-methyltransferase [Tetrahymena thermophila SB210]
MIEAYETDVFMDPIGMKVWEKRHQYVATKLSALNCKRVLDMGTNTCKLIQRLSRSLQFTQIDGLDIDGQLLETQGIQNAKPDLIQNQYASMRDHQLVVNLYQGSALNKIQHLKDQQYDAVILVELIEHLQVEDVFLIEQNLFGFLRPQFVIVTTPNSDFNVYFNFKEQGVLFRDKDHKFEWSQNQFQIWAQKVCQNYGYKVIELTGVGEHKTEGTKNGFCTQIVVFEKDTQQEKYLNFAFFNLQEGEIRQVCQILYPFESKEQHFQREVVDSIRYILHITDKQNQFEDGSYQNYTTLSRIMQNHSISSNWQIQGDYFKLKTYIQNISEFLVHENQFNFQESFVTLNYQAQMEDEENEDQLESDSENVKMQQQQYYFSNDNCFSTKDTTYSSFSTADNLFSQKIQLGQQQMALEEIELEDTIDY